MNQKDKDYQRELIELKKLRQQQADPESRPSHIPAKPEIPKGFVNKLKHFLYYYKFAIFAVLFVSLFMGICIGSCVNREKPDTTVLLLTGTPYLPEELEAIEQNIEKYCPDYNDDKNVHITLIDVYMSENNVQLNNTMQQRLAAEIAAGNSFIYISDKEGLARFNEINALMDLSELVENTADGNKSIEIDPSLLLGEENKRQTQLFVSMRYMELEKLDEQSKKGKNFYNSLDVFNNIINNKIVAEENQDGSNQQ